MKPKATKPFEEENALRSLEARVVEHRLRAERPAQPQRVDRGEQEPKGSGWVYMCANISYNCVYNCICMYVCIYIYTMYVYIYMYVCIHVHTYVFMHVCVKT